MIKWNSWVVLTENAWPPKPKILILWHLTEKVSDPVLVGGGPIRTIHSFNSFILRGVLLHAKRYARCCICVDGKTSFTLVQILFWGAVFVLIHWILALKTKIIPQEVLLKMSLSFS